MASLFITSLDGTSDQGLVFGHGSLSHDGTKLVYNGAENGLRILDISSGQISTLTNSANDLNPFWSPNGDQIAFMRQTDKGMNIFVMDANGQNARALTDTTDYLTLIGWMPDGRRLMVSVYQQDGTPVQSVDVTSGNIETLITLSQPYNGSASISPDGAWIAYADKVIGKMTPGIFISKLDGSETVMEEETFIHELDMRLPILNKQHRSAVLSAAAVAAYHAEHGVSIVQALVCDDAPQFKWLTRWLALCWIHEGRHYKKLEPVVALHQTLLKDFLTRFWAYYDQLLEYRQRPTAQEALRLEAEFDSLFGAPSGYAELDKRIASTRSNKDALLLVLKFPELPLHNNPAELGARGRVRKRDVSFGPRTEDGKQAWDTFMTLAATTKKLNVSFYEYVRDRILKKNGIPPLSDLITKAAHELMLGQSYSLACP